MEWRPAGWSMCLPLLIFPCTIKSRSSLLAPAHPGCPGKRAVKRLWWFNGVHAFGYNSAESEPILMKSGAQHSEYIAWAGPGRFGRDPRRIESWRARRNSVFCQVSSARCYPFPVGQISRTLNQSPAANHIFDIAS